MDEKQQQSQQPTVIIQQSASNPFAQMGAGGNNFNIKDILFLCLGRWWWFVISLAICVSIGWYQVRTSPKIYSRTAKLMIKSDNKQSIGGISDGLSEVGINKNRSNLSNELIAMKAPSIYQALVREYGLNTTYSRTGRLLDKELYGKECPIRVNFVDLGERDYAEMSVRLDGKGGVSIFRQAFAGNVSEDVVPASFDDTLSTVAGKVVITKSSSYWSGITFDIHVKRVSVGSMAASCSSRVSLWTPDDGASTINISCRDVSYQRAEDILNGVIKYYNENWIKDRNQVTVATAKFIGERLAAIERELSEVEDNVTDFRSMNLLPESGTMASTFLNQSMQSDQTVLDLNNQLYMCRYVRNCVADSTNSFQLLPVNTGLGSGSAESLIVSYNSMLIARNQLLAQSSLSNPLVKEYDEKLSIQRDLILSSIDNQMLVIETQIKNSLQQQGVSTKKFSSSLEQSKYLHRVQRQLKVKETLYTYLLQKREEAELNQAFIAYNSRLISAPSGSMAPISPDVNKIYTYAGVAGVAIPLAIILILYMLNTKVRGRRDLEHLKVPFVGELPFVESHRKDKGDVHKDLEVKTDGKNMINEAFRIIRSNLSFMMTPKPGIQNKVVMVTSINAGSGKTFIMANLAASFAVSGKKVLVLDLDLRKRSISKYIGRPKSGISTYLSGQSDNWRDLVKPIPDYENLFMLPAGRSAPNPAELLQSDAMKSLVEEAKKEYDYIFLDCPPAEIVADATIIKPLAEITLFVARVGVMERSHLPVIEEYYNKKTFNNLCVILNGSEALHSRYGYYRYGYGYSYGYGYGYGYGYNYSYYGEKDDNA
ncbi:MAG: polysaccharide biosynthesis tyrosine autokinase [Bacteroidales bacterium]|jgi:capsular exopolysaccharide synthesis family protein|nr:polysaccharide biosynthesis tyrosine autokinase [Bacteroidales bacterium]